MIYRRAYVRPSLPPPLSAEVMYSSLSVCLSVCLSVSVSKVTPNVTGRFPGIRKIYRLWVISKVSDIFCHAFQQPNSMPHGEGTRSSKPYSVVIWLF